MKLKKVSKITIKLPDPILVLDESAIDLCVKIFVKGKIIRRGNLIVDRTKVKARYVAPAPEAKEQAS